MKLCQVRIAVLPLTSGLLQGVTELRIEVRTGWRRYEITECLPEDHFASLFDRVIERAVEQLKEGIRKEESLTESKS